MANLIHIGEVAALLFVAYQLSWFVGFVLRRAVSPRQTAPIVAAAPVAVEPSAEAPIRTPIIAPIPAMPPAPTATAASAAVEALLAKVEDSAVVLPDLPPAAIAVTVDVRPPPIPTSSDADVTPPPMPLSADFLAELQSAMLERDPPEETPLEDVETTAAVTAAFEQAFELTPVPIETEMDTLTATERDPQAAGGIALTPDEDQPGLFDLPPDPVPIPAPLESVPAMEAEPVPAVAAATEPDVPPSPTPTVPPPQPSKDAMPIAPMAPATEPAMVATNAPAHPPASVPVRSAAATDPIAPADPPAEASTPTLRPASKPGEVWSGRANAAPRARTGILRPAGAPRPQPQSFAAARPASPPPPSRTSNDVASAVAAAAAKVQQVVAAAADFDDGIEASDEDAEAAAMRAIESGWMRKATPRTTKPERPEGVPPAPPKKR
jgi:hypothetical protein